MQAAPSDDMFAGLTSSVTPPIGRLTIPTSTTPTTGGVNSTSGLDLSSLATTRLQTTSYQTPPMPRLSGSPADYLAPSVPLQPTPAAAVLTPSPAVLGGGGTSWSPATAGGGGMGWSSSILQPVGVATTSPTSYSTSNSLLKPTQSSWANWSGGGQSTGATPTTALEPLQQGSILQPTPSQLSSSNSSTMGWSSGCQLSTAAGTSPLLVPTAHQTAFPRQPALGDNPFADNSNSLI